MSLTQIIYEKDIEDSIFDTKNFRELNTWVSLNCDSVDQGSDFRLYKLDATKIKNLKKDIVDSLATKVTDMAEALASWSNRDDSDDTQLGIELDLAIEDITDTYSPFTMTIENLSDTVFLYKLVRLYEALVIHSTKYPEKPLHYEVSV